MGYVFSDAERWIDWILVGVWSLFRIWAVADCATRTSQAFPAVNKLTKPVWLAITVGGLVIGSLLLLLMGPAAALNPISLITLIASLVYLADVRPAVREVSGGSGQRW